MNDQDKVKAARAAYAREYRKKHPDKVKAAQEKYWLKRLEQELTPDTIKGSGDSRAEENI